MPYAVRKGRSVGVYDTWDECREQVDRYPSASFKKCSTYQEAQGFVEERSYAPSTGTAILKSVVYTDGCCSRNGRDGATGGIGVYWGPDSSLNVSERLEGRQTNQRAEIQVESPFCRHACFPGVLVLQAGMTEWVPRWKQNGWKTIHGGDVVNKEDFQKLDNLCKNVKVTWTHVPGHTGQEGNEMADQLARSGARK
ncbi:PREDICTED: ribonuclease H1-like [Nanorana parkeri]|uniref:ribonuclease H1-like n=1 Tax=Nanorana parkeri TaxID=125878 RepID=UPI000854A600|nr:PREDICTED: ribonuclease H1-like [Nanorana parkeri]